MAGDGFGGRDEGFDVGGHAALAGTCLESGDGAFVEGDGDRADWAFTGVGSGVSCAWALTPEFEHVYAALARLVVAAWWSFS